MQTGNGSVTIGAETVAFDTFADFGGLVNGVLDAQAEDRGILVFALKETKWEELVEAVMKQEVNAILTFPPPQTLDGSPLADASYDFVLPFQNPLSP